MMGNGHISKRKVEAVKIALGAATQQQADKQKALEIWNAFRWQMQTGREAHWTEQQLAIWIDALLLKYMEQAEREIGNKEIREAVLKRFNEARARLSENDKEPPWQEPA